MADDINDFLRRAAQRRKAATGGGGGGAQPARNPPPPRPPAPEPPPRTIAAPLSQPQQGGGPQRAALPSAQAERAASQSVPTIADPISLTEDDVARLSVDQADERLQDHMRQVFQHDVGRLPTSQTQLTDEGAVTGLTLFNLLQQPGGLQTAFLLHEILDRPKFRW